MASMIELDEYMEKVWQIQGHKRCKWCDEAIIHDHDSGYWLHAAFGKVDGRNGLFCNAEEWDKPSPRKYVMPT